MTLNYYFKTTKMEREKSNTLNYQIKIIKETKKKTSLVLSPLKLNFPVQVTWQIHLFMITLNK